MVAEPEKPPIFTGLADTEITEAFDLSPFENPPIAEDANSDDPTIAILIKKYISLFRPWRRALILKVLGK